MRDRYLVRINPTQAERDRQLYAVARMRFARLPPQERLKLAREYREAKEDGALADWPPFLRARIARAI
jgi:hypothetical protein